MTLRAAQYLPWHPGRCAEVLVGDTVVGHAGQLHPAVDRARPACRRAPARRAQPRCDSDRRGAAGAAGVAVPGRVPGRQPGGGRATCRPRPWPMRCARAPANCWKTCSCSTCSPARRSATDRKSLTLRAAVPGAGSHADRRRRQRRPRRRGATRRRGRRRRTAGLTVRAVHNRWARAASSVGNSQLKTRFPQHLRRGVTPCQRERRIAAQHDSAELEQGGRMWAGPADGAVRAAAWTSARDCAPGFRWPRRGRRRGSSARGLGQGRPAPQQASRRHGSTKTTAGQCLRARRGRAWSIGSAGGARAIRGRARSRFARSHRSRCSHPRTPAPTVARRRSSAGGRPVAVWSRRSTGFAGARPYRRGAALNPVPQPVFQLVAGLHQRARRQHPAAGQLCDVSLGRSAVHELSRQVDQLAVSGPSSSAAQSPTVSPSHAT